MRTTRRSKIYLITLKVNIWSDSTINFGVNALILRQSAFFACDQSLQDFPMIEMVCWKTLFSDLFVFMLMQFGLA